MENFDFEDLGIELSNEVVIQKNGTVKASLVSIEKEFINTKDVLRWLFEVESSQTNIMISVLTGNKISTTGSNLLSKMLLRAGAKDLTNAKEAFEATKNLKDITVKLEKNAKGYYTILVDTIKISNPKT